MWTSNSLWIAWDHETRCGNRLQRLEAKVKTVWLTPKRPDTFVKIESYIVRILSFKNDIPKNWHVITWPCFSFCIPMMTSSNGNYFRVTGHLCGAFTGHRWIPSTKTSDAELWCFELRLNKPLSKQSWGWWFETPSRHSNGLTAVEFEPILSCR